MSTVAGLAVVGALFTFNPNNVTTYWFALPLVVVMSCVYSASRVESTRQIAVQSVRLAGMILLVLFVAMALLLLMNSRV